jgi:hypothetical protein
MHFCGLQLTESTSFIIIHERSSKNKTIYQNQGLCHLSIAARAGTMPFKITTPLKTSNTKQLRCNYISEVRVCLLTSSFSTILLARGANPSGNSYSSFSIFWNIIYSLLWAQE